MVAAPPFASLFSSQFAWRDEEVQDDEARVLRTSIGREIQETFHSMKVKFQANSQRYVKAIGIQLECQCINLPPQTSHFSNVFWCQTAVRVRTAPHPGQALQFPPWRQQKGARFLKPFFCSYAIILPPSCACIGRRCWCCWATSTRALAARPYFHAQKNRLKIGGKKHLKIDQGLVSEMKDNVFQNCFSEVVELPCAILWENCWMRALAKMCSFSKTAALPCQCQSSKVCQHSAALHKLCPWLSRNTGL